MDAADFAHDTRLDSRFLRDLPQGRLLMGLAMFRRPFGQHPEVIRRASYQDDL